MPLTVNGKTIVKSKTNAKLSIYNYIFLKNLLKKLSFWNYNGQDRMINEKVMTKKNFDEQNNQIL